MATKKKSDTRRKQAAEAWKKYELSDRAAGAAVAVHAGHRFTNEHGEVWFATYDRAHNEVLVTGEDVGWEVKTTNSFWTWNLDSFYTPYAMDDAEKVWLRAVLLSYMDRAKFAQRPVESSAA